MKYYSKSPEEWKKEDEKKRLNDKTQTLKRRAWIFLFVNVLLVFGVFMLIGIYMNSQGVGFPFFQSRSTIPGPIKIYIKFSNPEGVFRRGEVLDIKVYAQNTEKYSKILIMKNFKFEILTGVDDIVYVFNYPSEVRRELKRFESILVFDLKREKTLDDLMPGEYKIKVDVNLNGKYITFVKSFRVEEKYSIVVGGFQPFYFIGEIPYFRIGIKNENYMEARVIVKSLRLRIEDEKSRKIEERTFKFKEYYKIPAQEVVEVTLFKSNLKFDRMGTYRISVSLDTDKGTFEYSKYFKVITTSFLGIDNIGIVIETPINVVVNEVFEVKVYLYNSSSEDRFVLVKDGQFFVSGNGEIHSDSIKNLRIWFTRNEKVEIFSKEISLDKPGDYKVIGLFKTDFGNIYKELKIHVGGEQK